MLARENYSAEHITGLRTRTRTGADPSILERTVFAFGLLEQSGVLGCLLFSKAEHPLCKIIKNA